MRSIERIDSVTLSCLRFRSMNSPVSTPTAVAAMPHGLARRRVKSDFMPETTRPVHSTFALSAMTEAFTAAVYSPTAVVVVTMTPR